MEHTTDVEGLRERLSYPQLIGWIEYHKQHPFGDDWEQAATIAAACLRGVSVERLIPRRRRKRMSAVEITRTLDEFHRGQ